jgi:hypothetical protein
MIEIANQLVQSLFKKNSLQECSRWELEILADKYPYFGIAQLLVSGKLKEENIADYEKQVQKTSLYFTNPLWLDYVLNKKQPPSVIDFPETTDHAQQIVPETSGDGNNEIIELPTSTEVQSAPAVPESLQTIEPISEEIDEVHQTEPSGEVDVPIVNDEPVQASTDEAPVLETESAQTETKEDIPVADSPADSNAEDKKPQFSLAPLDQESLMNINAPLTFEPYHTVDYFASQGIKLSLDEKPKDRFGQQLKSFTQWLKTIKNTAPSDVAKELGQGTEQKVVTLAEHSLEDREIVTEAMAEVWLKQGKKEKAIAVYNKLSLQNPAKSAYFASLIEQLKQH